MTIPTMPFAFFRNFCPSAIALGALSLAVPPLVYSQSPIAGVPGLDLGGLNLAGPVPGGGPLNVTSPLMFNFTKGAGILALEAGTPTQMTLAANVVAGFSAAADLWRAAFIDPITINLTIDFQALGAGILGSTSSATAAFSYTNTRTALLADISLFSPSDLTATSNLPVGASRTFFTNDRANVKFLDNDGSANNTILDVPRANAKAIGLIAPADPTSDGSITFSSAFQFNFNRMPSLSEIDFVGVAAHEIGHLMGFVSGVDTVDAFSGAGPNAATDLNGAAAGIGTLDTFRVFSVLDMYRYSAQAVSQGPGVLDLADAGAPFFSINGGATNLGTFATGSFNGDGRQASHWKDNLTLGIMDPTLAFGEVAVIRPLDLQAMDVIGYNPVPEPGTVSLLVFSLVTFSLRRRRSGFSVS